MAKYLSGVNPVILKWARERSGYTIEGVALAFKKGTSEIEEWERTMAQDQIISTERYPYLRILAEVRGVRFEHLALLDTGYTGELIIPESALQGGIGIPADHTDIEVGDNRVVNSPIYLGSLEIIGFPLIPGVVVNVIGDEYIIGLGILDLFSVTFDYGQRVIVRP